MTQEASWMRVLVRKGRRVYLLIAWERSRGLLLHESSRGRIVATRAKARVSYPKMGDTLGLLASQGRGHVSCATNQDILDGFSLRGKDLRVSGQYSPSRSWDRREHSLFLHPSVRVRGTSISFRFLHKHLLPHRQARVCVEGKSKAHWRGLPARRYI